MFVYPSCANMYTPQKLCCTIVTLWHKEATTKLTRKAVVNLSFAIPHWHLSPSTSSQRCIKGNKRNTHTQRPHANGQKYQHHSVGVHLAFLSFGAQFHHDYNETHQDHDPTAQTTPIQPIAPARDNMLTNITVVLWHSGHIAVARNVLNFGVVLILLPRQNFLQLLPTTVWGQECQWHHIGDSCGRRQHSPNNEGGLNNHNSGLGNNNNNKQHIVG